MPNVLTIARVGLYAVLFIGGVVAAVIGAMDDPSDGSLAVTGFGFALAGLSGFLAEISDSEVADLTKRVKALENPPKNDDVEYSLTQVTHHINAASKYLPDLAHTDREKFEHALVDALKELRSAAASREKSS